MKDRQAKSTRTRNHLSRSILLTIGAILITWANPLAMGKGVAQTILIPAPSLQEEQPAELLVSEVDTLPTDVKTAVINDAARRTSRTVSAMKILEAKPQEWSDGCLGLGQPDEICTQAITPGYQVTVTDGLRNWTYRTNEAGNVVRLSQLDETRD